MTLSSAESITKCVIQVASEDDYFFVVAIRNGIPIATHTDRSLKKALKGLVDKVYAINREAAYRAADYRCSRCGKIVPLHSHHKIHRARGQRDDSVENLEILCAEHHGKEHGG